MAERLIWFKGEITSPENAKVMALSPTAQFGLNVFEGVRGYWNRELEQMFVFRLRDHLHRLQQSCKLIALEMPYSIEQIEQFIREIIGVSGYREDVALRITVFVDGEDTWSSVRKPELFIAPISKPRKDAANLPTQTATVSSWRRIDDVSFPPRVKCGANYINGRYAHLDARRKGFDLPIFLNAENKVSEGAGACIAIVRNGTLITPDTSSDILESITRDTILRLSRAMGISCEERRVDRTELLIANEVFLCGTAAEVTPISSIDHVAIGDGGVGRLTAMLAAEYFRAASHQNPEFPDWTFPIY
ncbi:aminotransferase class IV [Rhodopseudomonas palustris]|uniref:aminotransferase class IV n=1 Tax=Rhodopseudomonas palustris TaxID=1076 RepID=UPI0021F368D3|nr:aminotransferase class IV [Rhodopseudomonas palustris]UYO44337.1 aminotransferase class IV [Rhodopseudomonas palustris]